MAAMHLNGDVHYASARVTESVIIAVVAASVALWLTLTVSKPIVIFVSALVMGVAVNGMHFTGMSAMSVREEPATPLSGATASSLLIPIGVAVIFGVLGLAYALQAAPTEEDRAGAAYLESRRQAQSAAPAAAPARRPLSPPPSPPAGQPPVAQTPPAPQAPPMAPIPKQPTRQTRLGGSNWTYRDRTPR